MKLSFSTLGCPDFDWSDIYSLAKDFGFSGIELRGLGNSIFSVHAKPFSAENIDDTISQLRKMHLEIPCISSGCCLRNREKHAETIAELKEYIDLAEKLGARYIRVLGDLNAEADAEVDDEAVLCGMRSVLPYAEEHGVTLLLETNGVYADTARLASLLNELASDAVGALWDLHHPYRYRGEKAETTVQNLGAYIKHTHIKDSVMENGKTVYKMMGEGDLPVASMMGALRSINYEGYVSLEWLKQYAPELSDAGIVFPHFANYMGQFMDQPVEQRRLFDNNAGTGKYVWRKERLIDYTFPQVLDRMVEEFPDQYCFRYTTLPYTRTYAEFRDDVDTFARSLIAMGVKPGDHVAIWATNIPQWYITFWATTKIGAVLVTVNTAYKIHEAEYLLRQSDTHTLVMIDGYKDSDYLAIMRELCPELENAGKREAAAHQAAAVPAQYYHLRERASRLLYLGGGGGACAQGTG